MIETYKILIVEPMFAVSQIRTILFFDLRCSHMDLLF